MAAWVTVVRNMEMFKTRGETHKCLCRTVDLIVTLSCHLLAWHFLAVKSEQSDVWTNRCDASNIRMACSTNPQHSRSQAYSLTGVWTRSTACKIQYRFNFFRNVFNVLKRNSLKKICFGMFKHLVLVPPKLTFDKNKLNLLTLIRIVQSNIHCFHIRDKVEIYSRCIMIKQSKAKQNNILSFRPSKTSWQWWNVNIFQFCEEHEPNFMKTKTATDANVTANVNV